MINGQVEEKVCGDGPCLEDVFEDDTQLQDINSNIQVVHTAPPPPPIRMHSQISE